MIFNHKPKVEVKAELPSLNDERVVAYFAFLPVRLHNQTRWLEFVSIKQRYGNTVDPIVTYHFWEDINFVEKTNDC